MKNELKNNLIEKKARYIVSLVKDAKKPLSYAIDIVAWYTMTDREQKQVESRISEIWNENK
jgi:hypothetical protein